MSPIQTKTPRSTDTPANTPEKSGSPFKSLKKKTQSPKLREQSGNPKNTLLSPSARQAGCIPPASPGATQPATDSPYKLPSSRSGAPASSEPASPRAYLNTLKPDNLVNAILRDQTGANAGNYPTAWIKQVQISLEEPVGKLLELVPDVLAAVPKKGLNLLYPDVGCDADFNWKPFDTLCASLWPHFSAEVISLEALPPRTLGLLAEFHGDLARLPDFRKLGPDARDKVVSDALFNLLIWNGIFSPLTNTVPEQYKRLVNGLCTYVKAAWGNPAQTQGRLGQAIVSMVPADHRKQCAAFRIALMDRVANLAALRTVEFHDKQDDQRLNNLREKNIDRHFTETWVNRVDDQVRVVKKGNYYLTDAEGIERPCKSYDELGTYVGNGSKNLLPQVVLHVAGDRIKNFLCNTYLYSPKNPLFTSAQGQRVDPVPKLQTKFILSRSDDGRITARFSCVDHAVKSAMLVEPDDKGSGVEAVPLFQASIEFHGEIHFYPNEEFEAGHILVTGQNLHMFR